MAKQDDGQLEGIGRSGRSDRRAGAYEQWASYLEQQEQLDQQQSVEEMARQGHVVGEAQPLTGASVELGSAKAIEEAGAAAQVLSPKAQDDRITMMAAMQAEALARLELGGQADNVNAAVRAVEGLDEAARLETTDESTRKHLDGVLLNREQQLDAGALVRPTDYVTETDGLDTRSASERQEDRDHARMAGAADDPAQVVEALQHEQRMQAQEVAQGLGEDIAALRDASPHAYQILQELGRQGGDLAALEQLDPDTLAKVEKAARKMLVLTSIVGEDATSVKMAVTLVTDDGSVSDSTTRTFDVAKDDAVDFAKGLREAGVRLNAMRSGGTGGAGGLGT